MKSGPVLSPPLPRLLLYTLFSLLLESSSLVRLFQLSLNGFSLFYCGPCRSRNLHLNLHLPQFADEYIQTDFIMGMRLVL